jgi:hypothetical protein
MGHVETARSGATEKYLLGELGEEDSARYEHHFFDCGACAEDVEMSAAFLEAMRGVLDDYFADSPRSHWRGLFCMRPEAQKIPVPVGTPMLRSLVMASRARGRRGVESHEAAWFFLSETGATARVIPVPPGQSVLRFTLDLGPGPIHPRYRCAIQDAHGRTMESAILAGPTRGCALHISMPISRFAFGSYEVTLEGLDRDGASVTPHDPARYSFTFRTLED